MSNNLQASLELQVELSRFYNVDLFQRGYYQIRVQLKYSPKAQVKYEVCLPFNNDPGDLLFPAAIINGTAVSKTFHIKYRGEQVDIADIVLFKIESLVDPFKVNECIEQCQFSLNIELWFADEDSAPQTLDRLKCCSEHSLRLHLDVQRGIHRHLPVIFDYFHLSSVTLSLYFTLLSLHTPYDCLPKQQSSWCDSQSTFESTLFADTNRNPTLAAAYAITDSSRIVKAAHIYRTLCTLLLSVHESLLKRMQAHRDEPLPMKSIKCHRKLEKIMRAINLCKSEETFLEQAQITLSKLCAENLVLWSSYLSRVTSDPCVQRLLAADYHRDRVHRLSQAVFTCCHSRQAMSHCYSYSHSTMANTLRGSDYMKSIPQLDVECKQMDGDSSTMPIIFEDSYNLNDSAIPRSISQSSSITSSEGANPLDRKRQKHIDRTAVRASISGIKSEECMLIGFRKSETVALNGIALFNG